MPVTSSALNLQFIVCCVGDSASPFLQLLLVDEVQALYPYSTDPLWGKLKSLTQGPQAGQPPQPLRIIVATMYGTQPSGIAQTLDASPLTTPFAFLPEMTVTLKPPGTEGPRLNLDLEEYKELMDSFNQAYNKFGGLTDTALLQYLFDVTAGQVNLSAHRHSQPGGGSSHLSSF